MRFVRTLVPLRGAHFLRPRRFTPFLNVFERDPFFAELGPLFNAEFARFQRYKPRWAESPKVYRLELDVPGFRKDEISMELLESGRIVRIAGQRQRSRRATEGEGTYSQSHFADSLDAQGSVSAEAAQQAEGATTTEPAVSEVQSKEVQATTAEDGVGVADAEHESFTVDYYIPEDADTEAVKASLEHGILSIVFPKSEAKARQKITIE